MKSTKKAMRKQQDVATRPAKNGHATQSDLRSSNATTAPGFVKKRATTRKISSLHPHPKQPLIPDLPPDELRRLADSLKKDGLIELVEILPDGTIISGHQRIRAAKLLGWKEIRCWVRYDLSEQGDDAATRRLFEANFHRRHSGPLDKARWYRELLELERATPRGRREIKGDLRDYLAGQFGCSGRNLDRWAKLLDTPMEVQRAVIERKLKLVVGAELASLPQETQERIARAIRKGTEPKQAVAEHVTKRPAQTSPDTLYRRFRGSLEQAVSALPPNIKELSLRYRRHDLPLLRRGRKLLEKLESRIEKIAEPEAAERDREIDAMLATGKSKP